MDAFQGDLGVDRTADTQDVKGELGTRHDGASPVVFEKGSPA